MKLYASVDQYIADYPEDIRKLLETIRQTIREVVPPETKEVISYGIPTFRLHGNLVHYGVAKSHIGFYPGSAPVAEFAKELEPYETSKGTIRFPFNKPLPLELIRKITLYCIERNLKKRRSSPI